MIAISMIHRNTPRTSWIPYNLQRNAGSNIEPRTSRENPLGSIVIHSQHSIVVRERRIPNTPREQRQ